MKKAKEFNYKGFKLSHTINGKLIFKDPKGLTISSTIDNLCNLEKQIDLLS